jgi:hypothetical protein
MQARSWLAIAFALLATLAAAAATLPSDARPAQDPAQDGALRALDGEWIYVEDRTAGRALEEMSPPMNAKFSLRIEEGAVVLVSGHGSGHRDVRVALDGSITSITEDPKVTRYRGAWKDGVFSYEVDFIRGPGQAPSGSIRRDFRGTPDGLLVRFIADPAAGTIWSAIYRHPQDIALPTPAQAAIADLSWLAGAWVGTRGKSSIEERWSPALGGSMLAVSRTVSGSGKLSAFEYLRIVERDGGLVYVAQPGGKTATEFTLTELGDKRAVFQNPRHDSPQRIVYELSADGVLSASIGYAKGGKLQRFEFKREGG